jgi:hypothetical protein
MFDNILMILKKQIHMTELIEKVDTWMVQYSYNA